MIIVQTTVAAKPPKDEVGVPGVFMDLVRWMEDNVGAMYVDWSFDPENLVSEPYLKVRIQDDNKAALVKLRWS